MIRIALIVCCAVVASVAQENLLEAQHKLDAYNNHYRPEYIDLVFDRDYYFSGDRIWYSLYVSNYGNTINALSSIAYVEIHDEYDSILVRQKLRCRDGKSHGEIRLPRNMPSGLYKISAYTLWMKNIEGTDFNKMVAIVNIDNPLPGIDKRPKQESKSLLTLLEDSSEIQMSVVSKQPGMLLVKDRSEVYAVEKFLGVTPLKISLTRESINHHEVNAFVLDQTGMVLEEHMIHQQKERVVTITSNKSTYKPGDKATLTIALKDEFGNLINGSISLAVTSGGIEKFHPPWRTQSSIQFLQPLKQHQFNKEQLIYPVSPKSLSPIDFRIFEGHSGFPLYLTEADKVEIEKQGLRRKIMEAYQADVINYPERNFIIPYDNTFRVVDYAPLKSMDEFIREIVPQLRIKKRKSDKVIRVRNSDHPNQIYFFEGQPLILINDRVATQEELLALQCQEVEHIDVLWSTDKINSLAIFSLADNGVVSVRTKSDLTSDTKGKFLEGIHTPLQFSNPKLGDNQEGEVPLFFEPVFWAPDVHVNGKAIITINLSSVIGDLTVTVSGYTTSGQRVHAMSTLKVY